MQRFSPTFTLVRYVYKEKFKEGHSSVSGYRKSFKRILFTKSDGELKEPLHQEWKHKGKRGCLGGTHLCDEIGGTKQETTCQRCLFTRGRHENEFDQDRERRGKVDIFRMIKEVLDPVHKEGVVGRDTEKDW